MAGQQELDLKAILEEVKELRKLRAEVQELRDRQEILDVMAKYSRTQDRKDWKLYEQVFHPEAIFDSGTKWDFVGPISELTERGRTREWPATLHVILNHLCEIDGDTAHTETYAITYLLQKDEKTVHSSIARYIDRLERRDGKWKIALRRIVRNEVVRLEVVGTAQKEGKEDHTDISYQRPLTLPPERAELIGSGKARSHRTQ